MASTYVGLATAALLGAVSTFAALRRRGPSIAARCKPVTGALTGSLYRYKASGWPAPLQAFEGPHGHRHTKYCVYVGGLTDGLLACRYVDQLAAALDEAGWALVQPVLSSSYTGYGISSLARDAEELSESSCAPSTSARPAASRPSRSSATPRAARTP